MVTDDSACSTHYDEAQRHTEAKGALLPEGTLAQLDDLPGNGTTDSIYGTEEGMGNG